MKKILIKCPRCTKTQNQNPEKTWQYGKIILKRNEDGTKWGASIHCSRYFCEKCKQSFNYYVSSKDKTWTIPKSKKS